MSHWTECKINIKNPSIDVLKKALQAIAQELGSKLIENFTVEGWGHTKKCLFGIPMSLPYGNGYGINIENGEIKVFVDDHGAPLTAEEFTQKLMQYYTAVAFVEAAKRLGFKVTNLQQLKNNIIIDVSR